MQSHNTIFKTLVAALGALFLSACQSEAQTSPNLKFSAPSRIMQVRAVDRSQLSPEVTLSNGARIPMQRTGDNSWSGTINVLPNATYSVSVEWIENISNRPLVLARWSDDVEVSATGGRVELSSQNYDFDIDTDSDSFTNLEERENETDPFVPNGSNSDELDMNEPADDEPAVNEPTDSTPSGDEPSNNEDDDQNNPVTNVPIVDTETPDSPTPTNNPVGRPTVLIPRISRGQAPDIDGKNVRLNGAGKLIGEWARAVQNDDSGAPLSIDRLMIDNGADVADGTKIRHWAAMHDGEYLYLVVLIDDVGAIQGDSDDEWKDDNLEIFIDGDNSKRQAWGDDNDFHYLIPLLKQDTEEANSETDGRFRPGPGSKHHELDLMFTTGPDEGPDGIRFPNHEQDVYEVAISIDSADIELGEEFGFEVQIDDDDDGGDRDSKWGWFHPSMENGENTDTTYLNPSVMGTLVLEE